jgi:hypothetical protein
MPIPQKHPHAASLDLLRLAITRLPPTFSKERKRFYEKKSEQMLDKPKTKYSDIQKVIVELGKESWAVRKAYDDMYARYGRSSEEAFLLENLDESVRQKYERYIHEGGKLNYIARVRTEAELLQPSPFERYFTPEEKFAIAQALLVARDQARHEIDGLVMETKRDEYKKTVKEYAERQRHMEEKIDELRRLAGVSSKWEGDIKERIRTLEEGWSVVEQGADLSELERETEYWKGTLGSFLQQA